MRRLPELLVALSALTLAVPSAHAQEPVAPEVQQPWQKPLEGLAGFLAGASGDLRVLVVSPQTDEKSLTVEKLVAAELRKSTLVALVMDDSPLGDISGKSDDELLAAAKPYPADVVLLLRTFPSGEDDVNVVVRIEAIDGSKSFHMSPNGAPPWKRTAKPAQAQPVADPNVVAGQQSAESGRQQGTLTAMGAVGIAETLRLADEAQQRRRLTLAADRRSPVVRGPESELVKWPLAYAWMDRADLASRYKGRRTLRIGLLAGGGSVAAAGLGMFFVGLTNQANCGGSTNGCGRPTLLIAGASALSVGAISLLTGLILKPQPIATAEIEALVDGYNATLAD